MAPSVPPWSQLPPELLGLVIDRLIMDRVESPPGRSRLSALCSKALQILPLHAARFRAALRSGQSAYADGARFRAVCRSCWLALDCVDNDKKRRYYFLHNPFSNTTVPLPELDTVIGDVSELFEVCKVVVRSTPDDIIAVMTNNWNHPIILIRPGKGVWLPEPRAAPFMYIIDIAFFGDKLYGITQAEDLVSLDMAFDNNGAPLVTGFVRLIKHPPGNYYFRVWRDVDEDDDNHEDENDDDDRYDEVLIAEDDGIRAIREIRAKTGDGMLFSGITYWEDDEVPNDPKDLVGIIWYLVKSRGKLFVVKRQVQWPYYDISFTRKMEVFELNVRACAWVPVSGGLDGHAFFVSECFCKSIAVHGDIQEDTIYFVDTGETFNVISQTLGPRQRELNHRRSMHVDLFTGSSSLNLFFFEQLGSSKQLREHSGYDKGQRVE
ncbi:hypothetical protein ACQ4PT_052157 [Festuca glaucescens]